MNEKKVLKAVENYLKHIDSKKVYIGSIAMQIPGPDTWDIYNFIMDHYRHETIEIEQNGNYIRIIVIENPYGKENTIYF